MDNTKNTDNPNQPEPNHLIKKRSFRKIIVPVLAVMLVLTVVCGIVAAKKKFRDGPHGFIIDKMTENLNLTDNQKAQVDRIKEQIREQMEANRPDAKVGLEELADEFMEDKLDKSTLIELKKKKDQKKEEMESFMMDKLIEFHAILTPAQREQAVKNMKEMRNKFHDRMKGSDEKRDRENRD